MNKISVAMRTYNGERYVKAQLASILHQTKQVDEIIICDDNSTDGTIRILQIFQKKYPDTIRLYTNKTNIGPDRNFEKVASLCTGDMILLSDQDDIWHTDKVAVLFDFFTRHPNAQMVFTDGNIIDSKGNHTYTTLWEKWGFTEPMRKRWEDNSLALEDLIRYGNKITGASIALRKELVSKALPMHPSSGYFHDAWLGIFAAMTHGLFFIEQPLFDYRIHATQLVGLLHSSPYNIKKNAICTIIAPNYIAQARALTESFLEHNPDGIVYALLVDATKTPSTFLQEKFIPVSVHDVAIPDFSEMALRYNIRELCTAVKPFFLRYLFTRYELGKICYFDPDIYFYNNIQAVWDNLETHDVVLTPHILDSLSEDFLPNEFSILRAGTYNLGFIGVRKSEETDEFLQWWSQRLVQYSHGAPDRQEHFDQRWIDLLPGFLDKVHIDRNPGMNVAYWDLPNRAIVAKNNTFYVNTLPLTFFHFSGYNPTEPDVISRHQNRFTFKQKPELRPLFDAYGKKLITLGYNEASQAVVSTQALHTIAKSYTKSSEYIRDIGPLLYGKITRYLADQGLEEFLTSLLGKRIIRIIRTGFLTIGSHSKPKIEIREGRGVNVFGLFEETSGVGEVARNIAHALQVSGVPVQVLPAIKPPKQQKRYGISIMNINADIIQNVTKIQRLEKTNHTYNIGYWWWELNTFPVSLHQSFRVVDELWVGSTFVQKALLAHSPVPVHVMGTPIEKQPVASCKRSSLGIQEQTYIFLFIFDLQSYIERKNPYAIIEAFKRAFQGTPTQATLIIKVLHAKDFPVESKKLQDALQEIRGIYISTPMSQVELLGLLAMCDCYISLHRSEGFGLTIAEAMYFKKPVIATNYSGNTDYMTNDNSYPVSYKLKTLTKSVGPYEQGSVWADPNIDEAASYMRYVTTHPEEAREKGKQASQDIREQYNNKIIGARMANRIAELYEQLTYSK